MNIRCKIFGHRENSIEHRFNELGRHVGVVTCTSCSREVRIAFTGPIYPGEAEDPSEAVKMIERYEDYEPPEEGGPLWFWDEKDRQLTEHGQELLSKHRR